MKKHKVLLFLILSLGIATTNLFADANKGQKLFVKKLKPKCGFTGADFAAKHSQIQWQEIYTKGSFKDEVKKICPKINKDKIKDSWIKHLYEFSYEYANDSGNVPSC